MQVEMLVSILTVMTSPLELLGRANSSSNSMLRDEMPVEQEFLWFPDPDC